MRLDPHRRIYRRQKVKTVLVAIALLLGAIYLVGLTWRSIMWEPGLDRIEN